MSEIIIEWDLFLEAINLAEYRKCDKSNQPIYRQRFGNLVICQVWQTWTNHVYWNLSAATQTNQFVVGLFGPKSLKSINECRSLCLSFYTSNILIVWQNIISRHCFLPEVPVLVGSVSINLRKVYINGHRSLSFSRSLHPRILTVNIQGLVFGWHAIGDSCLFPIVHISCFSYYHIMPSRIGSFR